jgi:spermidine synthase
MVSPYAIRLRLAAVEDAGHTAGRLYAISTVGSLAGTFLSSLLLIPFVGTRRTFLIFAAAMALAAVPHLVRGRLPAVVVPAVILGLIALPTGTIKSADTGNAAVIWERETEYQYARVIEKPDQTRFLELNEGHAVHSIYRPGEWLTGNYWDQMLAGAYAGKRPPRSVAILGSAAGTTARQLGHYAPQARVDAVEIDPELTDVGRELFDLGGPNLHTHTADARPWLRQSDGDYDVIVVDAYRQPYIPFYLATREFFELVRDRLAPGGAVIVNVGHPEGNDDLERAIGATMADVFPTVLRDPIEDANTLLLGTTGDASMERELAAVGTLPEDLRNLAIAEGDRLGPRLPGGDVWTDDKAPVEWLIDKSILGYAEDNGG